MVTHIVHEGDLIRREDLSSQNLSDLRTMCSMSENFKELLAGITVEGCIAEGRFSDGSSLMVKPSGLPEIPVPRLLCPIFNLDYNGDDSLFEFLIMLFVRDVRYLLRKGLRSSYTTVQSNETSFKGRMLFSDNIRENLVHKERVFVEYEIFSPDRPENRLIVGTLETLLKRSTSSRNRMDIRTILQSLEGIPPSTDLVRDLSKVNLDRNMGDYVNVMSWCDIFLNAMGLSDSDVSFFIVIDKSSLEEAYVARMSSYNRQDGSFSARCLAQVTTEQGVSSAKVIVDWRFYDIHTRNEICDAERLFLTCPGYRSLPGSKGRAERIEAMATDYLLNPVGGMI